MAWLKVFFKKKYRDPVVSIFYIILFSTITLIVGVAGHIIFRINITPLSQCIYLVIVTNLCFGMSNFTSVNTARSNCKKKRNYCWLSCIVFLMVYTGSYVSAIHIVPPLEDNDFELQGTAYGIMTRLRPYLLTDRKTTLHFAHPLLMHFYSGHTILFTGQLDKMRFYYDASFEAQKIMHSELHIDETVSFIKADGTIINTKITEIQNDIATLASAPIGEVEINYAKCVLLNSASIDKDTLRQARLW